MVKYFIISYHNSFLVSVILDNVLKKLARHDCVVYGMTKILSE